MNMENTSLGGRVFQQIRDDILNGRYRQGDELTEAALGKALGVSRTPVREALRQLALEGLVENIPNRGSFVTGISDQDVEDIYMIRSKLEGLCARLAADRITEEQLEKLEEAAYLSEYHTGKKHYEQVVELDGRFHEAMYEACQSRILSHTLSEYHQYVKLARRHSIEHRVRIEKSSEEHQQILEAIRDHDGDRAEELATRHILNVIENLKACKKEEEYLQEEKRDEQNQNDDPSR